MLEQVVQEVDILRRQTFELLSKLVALDNLAALLIGRKMKLELGRVPVHLAALCVLSHPPVLVGNHRICVAVDDVLHDGNFCLAAKHGKELGKSIATGQ